MINTVIPMAGRGSRFAKAGYELPKPFIDVSGLPMIHRVMKNLDFEGNRFILISQEDHIKTYKSYFDDLSDHFNYELVPVNGITEGTACTVLFAKKYIDNNDELLIANSDQIVDISVSTFIDDMKTKGCDGSIMVFKDKEMSPKWSFAKLNTDGFVTEVREKVPISDLATVGIYLYSKGSDFCDSAVKMILNQDKFNNEYYTCPTYNYLIKSSKKITIFEIDQMQMHGIGTPNDLDRYLKLL